MVQARDLPDDVIRIITAYYREFQVADMVERIHRFRTEYGPSWTHITDGVTAMMQSYIVAVKTSDDRQFRMPLNIPLCDFAGFSIIAQRNAWTITARRSANIAPV